MSLGMITAKFDALAASLGGGAKRFSISGMPHAAEAALILAIGKAHPSTVTVWICDGNQSLETTHRDACVLAPTPELRPLLYPAQAGFSREARSARNAKIPAGEGDPDISGHRLNALKRLSGRARSADVASDPCQPPRIIMASVQAMMGASLNREYLQQHTLVLAVSENHDLDALTEQLTRSGYEFGIEVAAKGQAALRGGILDLWPLTETWPVRVEFMGSSIESVRLFDPADQKTRERIHSCVVLPVFDTTGDPGESSSLCEYLPRDAVFVWSHMDRISEHAETYLKSAEEARATQCIVTLDRLVAETEERNSLVVHIGDEGDASRGNPVDPGLGPVATATLAPGGAPFSDLIEQSRQRILTDIRAKSDTGNDVMLLFDTDSSRDHFREQYAAEIPKSAGMAVAPVSAGFSSDTMRLTVIAEADLYGRRKVRNLKYDPDFGSKKPDPNLGARLTSSLSELEPGGFVVHIEHGIGIYRGLSEIIFNGRLQEVISIEYADKAKLHVPVNHAHLLSRYVGISRKPPALHRLGAKRWSSERSETEKAVADLAASLLETQAQRSILPGTAFPRDNAWQHEFEASFPYWETPDQQETIAAVKADMEASNPMDRLICGDAGYGKTEVAMRAAFKAVMAAKQVAVLVPTTILAQQHSDTFRERMSAYPVRIEMLSRFCSRSAQIRTVEGLADGSVDIVIGTHSVLQPEVRFKNLGLVIIDEEQRFGVIHKEWLKSIRKLVDVLTMTATPIPRTLYLSLTGTRDMSLIQTPPSERMAIQTIAAQGTDKVIREAIMRELNREGQVFYLHNRIMTIDLARQRLAKIVPEARVEVAHGQMPTSQLAEIVERFVAGDFDVLLSTTIIENGMDIPRANTILIDRADRFGIADLYQLRGRVGRSNRQAYAYLLLPSHSYVDSDARKRLDAVKEHSGLSSGFGLAIRDLEIRGAGNLLGMQQSGHVNSVGFGLYCQLLRRTVMRLKGQPMPPVVDVDLDLDFLDISVTRGSTAAAVIPFTYVEDERLRMSIYSRLAGASNESEIDALEQELKDRFGPLPDEMLRLLRVTHLRILAASLGITRVEVREGVVKLTRESGLLRRHSRLPTITCETADAGLEHLIRTVRSVPKWSA